MARLSIWGCSPAAERGGGLLGSGEIQALLQVDTGRDRVAIVERGGSQQQMAFAHQDRIALALRQVEELLAECSPGVQLRLGVMKREEAVERSEELWRFPHLLAERVSPAIGFSRCWRGHALRGHQQLPQRELQRQFALGPLGAVRQR